jgi:hypothetical protein
MDPRKNTTVTNGDWCVSCQTGGTTVVTDGDWSTAHRTGGGNPGVRLDVYKFPLGHHISKPMQKGDHFGRVFPSEEEAWGFALERGYTQWYGRNLCEFHSNRSFRRHTGRESMTPNDTLWQLHMRVGRHRGLACAR